MKTEDKNIMCKLIRDHEDLVGSSRLAMVALTAFVESIKDLKCEVAEIRELYAELSEAIKDTEPKVIPLIHLIEEFEREMEGTFGDDLEGIKKNAIRILTEKLDKLKSKVGKVIEHGLTCIDEGDVIIVHTISADVVKMLNLARDVFQKKFKVIVLKQDFVKTKKLIKTLSEGQIETLTVPEYNLSHYLDQANKMFIGAMSITSDMKVVSAVGTANIASLCHLKGLPIYLFANTLKFAHRPATDQRIHRKVETKAQDGFHYDLTTHSHDLLDLELVDYLITENGCMDKTAITKTVQKEDSSA